jgi:hypothetical protein
MAQRPSKDVSWRKRENKKRTTRTTRTTKTGKTTKTRTRTTEADYTEITLGVKWKIVGDIIKILAYNKFSHHKSTPKNFVFV